MSKNSPDKKIVMLIDDDGIHNYISEQIIKGTGFATHCFAHRSARSASEFLKNIVILEKGLELLPEFIFLDLYLPSMDGYDFLFSIGDLPEAFKKIKIVILTTGIRPVDEERCRRHTAVVKFLNKPLTSEKLADLEKEYRGATIFQ